MAKISAHGAKTVARRTSLRTGCEYLLTSDGRVLQKLAYDGATWKLFRRGITPEQFAAFGRKLTEG